MIVEFYGLPASGKSVTAERIAQETDFKVITVKNKSELLFLNILFACKHPVVTATTLWHIVRNSKNSKTFYFKYMNSLLHRNARYEKARRHKNALIVEGYFQNILSLFEKTITETEMKAYLRILPKPDKLIIFDLSSEERVKRLRERKNADFERHSNPAYNRVMEENNALFKRVIEDSSHEYFAIDAGQDAEGLARAVIAVITNKNVIA